jgi:peptide deformylase
LDAEVHELVEQMVATMCENEGVGLAAPQVGSLSRVIVARPDTEEDTEIFRLINPRIIAAEGSQEGMEGCLSLPSLRGEVERSAQVAVQAMTPEGENITIEATGLLARVFEHEIDHINSVLFVDRTAGDTLCWLIPDPETEDGYRLEETTIEEAEERFARLLAKRQAKGGAQQ